MIAVTGITGHTGGYFLQQLIDNHYTGKLRCLVRESSDTALLDSSGLDIEKCFGSCTSYEDLCRLVKGADTVLSIAGIWFSPSLLKAVEDMGGAAHVVLVHTTGIYSRYNSACDGYRRAEEKMQQYLDRGMNVTIIRPTMIFGDMRDRNVSKFIRMIDRYPLIPEIAGGRALIQPVNARDMGKIFYEAVLRDTLPEPEYIVSGERPISIRQLTDMIGKYLGKKTRYISCPLSLAVFGARAVGRLLRKNNRLEEKVLRMGEDRSFSHEAAARDLDYVPEPYSIGLKREVEEYLSNGRA